LAGKIGDYEEAISDYEAALKVDPSSSFAYYNCGIARDRNGDFAGAVKDFSSAIALEPCSNADFHHNRGFSLRKQVVSLVCMT
jgi:tetratricopeptide (TPR) repeat protein